MTRIHFVAEAVTPIHHMRESIGNQAVIFREPILTPNGIVYVPVISGNATRHCILRAPAAERLADSLGRKLRVREAQLLFHGGAMTEGRSGTPLPAIVAMQQLVPFLEVFGGCLPSFNLASGIEVWPLRLVCRETETMLRQSIPEDLVPDGTFRGSADFVAEYTLFRRQFDTRKSGLVDESDPDELHSPGIMGSEALIAGSLLWGGVQAKSLSRLALGCVLQAIEDFASTPGVIGGRSARGFSQVQLHYWYDSIEGDPAAEYREHLAANGRSIAEALAEAFATVEQPVQRGRPKDKEAPAEEPVKRGRPKKATAK